MSREENNPAIKSALSFAKIGGKVIPVHSVSNNRCSCSNPSCTKQGKHPALDKWPDRASDDPAQIKTWIEASPTTNLGFTTGKRSGVAVLDVDADHGGFESLAELEREIGPLPTTPTAKTGGGGRHYYFKYPNIDLKNSVGFRKGLDIRGDNGFVVAPPSVHKSGLRYEWLPNLSLDDVTLSPFPPLLIEAIKKPKKQEPKSAPDRVSEGNRNDSLFKYGCSLRAKGHEEYEIALLLLAFNEKHCVPPLEDLEVAGIVERCSKYEKGDAEKSSPNTDGQYVEKNGRIYLANGSREIALCNFTARINEEKVTDDGAERKTYFKISGELSSGTKLPTIEVTADRFPSMAWVTAWGSSAIIAPGYTTKDNLRAAIQELSTDTIRNEVFSHLGWRKINGEYYYLHAGGGLGRNGNNKEIKVDPSEGRLTDFLLPDPPDAETLKTAVQASIAFLDSAPDEITVPLFCGAYRAPLNEVSLIDYSVFVVGPTGVFKTSLIAIMQTHFGITFDDRRLPDNWSSTANTLERKAFLVKDAVFTVDDFVPGVVSDRDAERLFRAQGNKAGRGRMRPDGSLRPANYPRGMIFSTGEDVPKGQSLRPRLFIIEVNPGDIDPSHLGVLQKNHSDGLYAKAMAGYLQWLAPKLDSLRSELYTNHRELRTRASNSAIHKRTPDLVASLANGLEIFNRFAVEQGILSQVAATELFDRCWIALGKVAEKQVLYQVSEDPVKRFVDLIQASFVIGSAHLADSKTQDAPADAKRWGWRENRFGDLTPQGQRIGWVNQDEVWLQPDAAFAVVQRIANSQHATISVSKETLWKRLAHQGLIQVSEGEQKNLVKRSVAGGRPRVLIVRNKEILFGGPEIHSNAPVAPGTPGNGTKPLGSHLERAREFLEIQNSNNNQSPDGGVH